MLKKVFDKIDYRFLIILITGIVIRIISNFFIGLTLDADGYLFAAEGIINNNYKSHRPPIFPLLIVLFLLVIGNGTIAIRCASISNAILLIIAVYYVFKKASLKIFGNDDIGKEKSNNIALLVSMFVSLNFLLIRYSSAGQREDLLALFLILLFYFLFIADNKKSKRNYLFSALLCSGLTLTHVTVGIFLCITIILYYLFPKLKILDYQFSTIKVVIIFISFLCSFLFWLLFCLFNFGDPFYTMRHHQQWFKEETSLDLSSTEGIFNGVWKGFTLGIWEEFNALFSYIGIIFTLITYLNFKRYYKNNQIFYLYLLIFVNFLYISVFIAAFPFPRLILYFFPIFFFLGSILIINNLYEKKDIKIKISNFFKREISISLYTIFFIYLVFYVILQIFKLIFLINTSLYYIHDLIYLFSIIYEFFLLIIFIYPSYKRNSLV